MYIWLLYQVFANEISSDVIDYTDKLIIYYLKPGVCKL